MNQPKESRRNRLRPSPGTCFTPTSLSLGRIIEYELVHSRERSEKNQINDVPIYSIPIMIAYLRSLAIEIENQRENLSKRQYTSKLLKALETKPTNEITMICSYYRTIKATKNDAELLNHIRHEIIHPSPYPERGYNLPAYLHKLYKKGLLWTPPIEPFACNIMDFFCSHELMRWGAITISNIAEDILNSDIQYKHLNEVSYRLLAEIRKKAV